MGFDRLGVTSLVSAFGVVADVPYGICSQGIVLTLVTCEAAVVILPIEASEDPRYGPHTTRNGVYRVEDRSGQIARIGQGRVLDRVRRHRANRIVMPARLVCFVPRGSDWPTGERCYLEANWAAQWLKSGRTLAADTFITSFPSLTSSRRAALDHLLATVNQLVAAGLRLLDGDPLQEFAPSDETRSGPQAGAPREYHRTYPVGTRLLYETRTLVAKAIVRADNVVLLPESLVQLRLAQSVGAGFAKLHASFLNEAGVVPLSADIGRTTRPVAGATAAAVMKRLSAGRVHNADRWRPYPPVKGSHPRSHGQEH